MYNNREYQKTYINASASTTIFTKRGTLAGVSVNTTSTGVIVLYDGASPFANIVASVTPGNYPFNVIISNGLTVSTGGASDITVMWARG